VVSAIDPLSADLAGTATQRTSGSGFSDLNGYGWAADYINYAAAVGITNGYTDGTFKPGNNVTCAEMVTFLVRACGYTDTAIGGTWPSNFTAKGIELGLYADTGLVTESGAVPASEYAEKWMMAWMTYNALELIEAANPDTVTPPQGTDKDTPTGIPSTTDMTYTSSSFDTSMSTFAGNTIASDVVIYTYGLQKDYSKDMTFSSKTADYRLDTIYKYKNVKTPAWYKVQNGKITEMILPMDVGFSGKAYSVINGTIQTVNGQGKTVTGFETLTAMRDVTWVYKDKFSDSLTNQFKGELFELVVKNGEVTSVNTVANHSNKYFVYLADTDNEMIEVTAYNDRTATLRNGEVMEIVSNASVYVLNDAKDEYKTGSLSSIKAGKYVRLYDISDDDYTAADIVVVCNVQP